MPNHPPDEMNVHVPHAPPAFELRLTAVEAEQRRQGLLLDQIHASIVGSTDGQRPGQAEVNRQNDARLKRLERLPAWLAGVGTAIATALGAAWSVANVHIGKTPGGTP